MIVIDHYGIDHKYEKALKEITGITIFVLDDTYEKHYCDILLNHNIYAERSKYKNRVPENCELRCGAKYTLLREEFRIVKVRQKKTKQQGKNVFIAMGGADHSNLNIEILKVLENFPNIHANVVTTTANQYLEELQVYATGRQNVILHINTSQIAKLMSEADFAVVTPSVTVNEIIYMEIPFIAVKTASNQDEMYKYLAKKNYFVLDKFNQKKIKSKIELLLKSTEIEIVNFTKLSLEEKKMVLEWRNHPQIRKWMFTNEIISLGDHLSYIESLGTREDRAYFLVKKSTQAIGVIDFTNIDRKSKRAELGTYSNPEVKGVGNILMDAIINYAFSTLSIETLISQVYEENQSAIKLYKRYNFKTSSTTQRNQKQVCHMELKNENR